MIFPFKTSSPDEEQKGKRSCPVKRARQLSPNPENTNGNILIEVAELDIHDSLLKPAGRRFAYLQSNSGLNLGVE